MNSCESNLQCLKRRHVEIRYHATQLVAANTSVGESTNQDESPKHKRKTFNMNSCESGLQCQKRRHVEIWYRAVKLIVAKIAIDSER